MSTTNQNKIRITLLIENPSKNKNWGPLLRCCVAYGISTIYVIGYDQCDVRGSHGSSKHVQLISLGHSYNYKDAIQSLTAREDKENNGDFELIGLLSPLSTTNQEDQGDVHNGSSSSSTVIQEKILHQQKQTEKEIEIVRIGSRNEIKTIEIDNNNKSSSSTSSTDRSSDPIYEFCQKLKHQHQQQNNKKNQIKNICLVVDKLKCGLPFSLGKYCHSFIHIPHNNSNCSSSSTSSSMFTLEASVSIIFHELMSTGLCIGHTTTGTGTGTTGSGTGNDDQTTNQTNQDGQKYYVERIHKGGNPDSPNNTIERQKIRQERERKYQEQQDEANDLNSNINNDDGDY
ncbi:hypothetical protein FRACYDRAFT_235150 [Fragilariopsis cylindrus CCMP1102]|uniref:tRNA/rRNA methyltransferase SpoU type domain-containing protein n=1 Tax=Fragilariopsis cylindrus CCMP1102 TaxID=635003 RepID=A0A1E7FTS9_9STRA|nr:hypothetical protein FRACYDRAFT_235150 [Fragilariopsis cylindrus CCMP1102]|eukprot:OEU21524.1 hypothetical protein FRACYDRAFT_235150 [Fragilariopsis cylindrus CCMP1102]